MRGIGSIYDYETSLLEDDDEVAVVHGDESTGYRATSDAMVNIQGDAAGRQSARGRRHRPARAA